MTNQRATLGPRPLPHLPALDGVRLRVLAELTRRARPADVATLTARLGGHPNTIRGHLDVLTEAGLASRDSLPASGRGRPALGYAVTPAGRTAYRMRRAGGPIGPAEVTEALVAFLAERPDGAAQAREFGQHWGAGLAASGDAARGRAISSTSGGQPPASQSLPIDERSCDPSALPSIMARVMITLERMGFSPEPGEATEQVGASPTEIRLVTCPLLDAAREHPAVVCSIHHGLVEGLVEEPPHRSAGHSRAHPVTLVPFAEPGACLLTVSA